MSVLADNTIKFLNFSLRHDRLHELSTQRVCEAACDTCVLVNHKII
jgi:hypothetical protein